MNEVIITGRLATDAKFAATNSGAVVVSFRFAVNRTRKVEGQPDADFFNCVSYGKLAETLKRLSPVKGTKLAIRGTLRNANYKDKNGVSHYADEIVLDTFEFLEAKKKDSAPAQTYEDGTDFEEMSEEEMSDEELPF